ncbi:MAG TPA: PHP domain-containing protein [Thermoanaerobaculia bacterium]|nr:PHP domain-containing protein [Thermoanaerobaculia bacterium]HUM28643.1 PHP domain-containing protein [Thermoanaerobaculia bacterium]HXK66749.1 PHP domain-containing protein [Thermoanaerobaculia bacterium]
MRWYILDLHIHTCLSPCASLDMAPRTIAARAKGKGIDGLAICDHNTVRNVPALVEAGAREGLTVFGGIEITTREEVHILGIFPDEKTLDSMGVLVERGLSMCTDEWMRRDQVIANADHEVQGFHDKLLMGATTLSLEETVSEIHARDGIAISAHADREGFGLLGQLGFVPPDLKLDAVELRNSKLIPPELEGYTILASSDAHEPAQIGDRVTRCFMDTLSFQELFLAIHSRDGRQIKI